MKKRNLSFPRKRESIILTPVLLKLSIRGTVQGVGFRPFVFRLATELGLNGLIRNSTQGVEIEIEGAGDLLETFLTRLKEEKPAHAVLQEIQSHTLTPAGYTRFEIKHSQADGEKITSVLPDIATCQSCRDEIFNPQNRRYRYPFTTCTDCGPRFTIIESLPYDRSNTTMKQFNLCAECLAEYENPHDRRFHSETNACAACGPRVEFWSRQGEVLASAHKALLECAQALRDGKIVALKGLGGFQILADARNAAAVTILRERKRRERKPFAVMFPSMNQIKEHAEISQLEEKLLTGSESPIVLVRRRHARNSNLASEIAPDNPNLGIMLPCTPLHHLLMAELDFPIIATSGNLSDEPLCIDEHEAVKRLNGIADFFLTHNRPIARHADDSIVRVMAGQAVLLRRGRGYAPLSIRRKHSSVPLLAVGAHQKNTIAVARENEMIASQHIGDLNTAESQKTFVKTLEDFQNFYEIHPELVMCDAHPDYASTQFAERGKIPVIKIQHHAAHVLSCMADNDIEPPALGIAWDGAGYGLDGTLWGGEFLHFSGNRFVRAGHFRAFRLPGGDKAVQEPRRSALGLLYEIFGEKIFTKNLIPGLRAFPPFQLIPLKTMLEKGINSPQTSSVGRLFDGVSAILGLIDVNRFDGEAAMALEHSAFGEKSAPPYPFEIHVKSSVLIADWRPMLETILHDLELGIPAGKISRRFHDTLVEIIVAMAQRLGEPSVVLSGGCFQNKILTEKAIERLTEEGFRPYRHRQVPPNDGGIAIGQAAAVGACCVVYQKSLAAHVIPSEARDLL